LGESTDRKNPSDTRIGATSKVTRTSDFNPSDSYLVVRRILTWPMHRLTMGRAGPASRHRWRFARTGRVTVQCRFDRSVIAVPEAGDHCTMYTPTRINPLQTRLSCRSHSCSCSGLLSLRPRSPSFQQGCRGVLH
jgi:hypothetical protein